MADFWILSKQWWKLNKKKPWKNTASTTTMDFLKRRHLQWRGGKKYVNIFEGWVTSRQTTQLRSVNWYNFSLFIHSGRIAANAGRMCQTHPLCFCDVSKYPFVEWSQGICFLNPNNLAWGERYKNRISFRQNRQGFFDGRNHEIKGVEYAWFALFMLMGSHL